MRSGPRLKTRVILRPFAIGLLSSTLSCSGGPSGLGGPVPTVTGVWSGPMTAGTLTLVLEEAADKSVSGSGRLVRSSPIGGFENFTVTSGTHRFPDLTIVLTSQCAFCPPFAWTYEARVTEDAISGNLEGDGLAEEPVTLQRQQP